MKKIKKRLKSNNKKTKREAITKKTENEVMKRRIKRKKGAVKRQIELCQIMSTQLREVWKSKKAVTRLMGITFCLLASSYIFFY